MKVRMNHKNRKIKTKRKIHHLVKINNDSFIASFINFYQIKSSSEILKASFMYDSINFKNNWGKPVDTQGSECRLVYVMTMSILSLYRSSDSNSCADTALI